jgi:hypothetical protein
MLGTVVAHQCCHLSQCSCTLLVLLQMALAHAQDHSMSLRTPVVVLADKDKAEMDEEVG